MRGPRSPLYEALETAVGAQEAPLSVVISTQAATDGDLLSILIDDALRGADPTTVIKLYAAPPELDPFSEDAIRAANPALDAFMNKREVMAMAADARRMPARENEYRNFVLNQRIEASAPFLAPDVWRACGGEPRDITGLSVFGGLDLSESGDLTALVLAHPDPNDGVWHVRPFFWLPADRSGGKGGARPCPYDLWAEPRLSRNDARRGDRLRICRRAPKGNLRGLPGGRRSPSISGVGRTYGRGFRRPAFPSTRSTRRSFRLAKATSR